MKGRTWPLWVALLVTAAIGAAAIAFPALYITPFKPQATRVMQWAMLARTFAPVVTLVAAITSAVLALWLIVRSRRWWTRGLTVVVLGVVVGAAWFARQNHFEWMFNPLGTPHFVEASKATFVYNDDIVMGVVIDGQAVAYPILQLGYHHVANDVVSGKPIVATY